MNWAATGGFSNSNATAWRREGSVLRGGGSRGRRGIFRGSRGGGLGRGSPGLTTPRSCLLRGRGSRRRRAIYRASRGRVLGRGSPVLTTPRSCRLGVGEKGKSKKKERKGAT